MFNQFTQALCHQIASQLLRLADKYISEIKQEKEQRLFAKAEKKTASKGNFPSQWPPVFRAEVNSATILVENKKTQKVLIAHDMDPMELAVYLPSMCHRIELLTALSRGRPAGKSSPQEYLYHYHLHTGRYKKLICSFKFRTRNHLYQIHKFVRY